MTTKLKFQTTDSQPLILLPTRVNDLGPFDFVLDTGASMSIITNELADQIGIQPEDSREALGAGGRKLSAALGRVGTIAVGDAQVEDLQVGIFDELPKCIGQGAIGYNFLERYILRINYPSHWLTFASPTSIASQEDWQGTPVSFKLAGPDRPILLVEVLVNAMKSYPFVLDTGASHTVISPRLANDMGLRSTQVEPMLGAGGRVQGSITTLRSLTLGNADMTDMTALVADIFDALGEVTGAAMDGILGHNFLSHFKLEIDYPKASLRINT